MNTLRSPFSSPQGLFLLVFTQLWESFSFYGMRALLVLYLISELHYTEGHAFSLYALYTALIEGGVCLGGYCADRFLGLRRAILWGGGTIAFGHICLTFSESLSGLFLGLACIIVGSSLFRGNLKALVGSLYGPGDPQRESGFTLFYAGLNMGGFAAALLCALVANQYGWHAGLGLAALGMLIGIGVFAVYYKGETMQTKGFLKEFVSLIASCIAFAYLLQHHLFMQQFLLPMLGAVFVLLLYRVTSKIALRQAIAMIAMLVLLIGYFVCDELMGSLLMVFSENRVDRMLWGSEIPSAALSAVNPLTVIVLGPVLAFLLNRFGLGASFRSAGAYLCLMLGFGVLYLASVSPQATATDMAISFALIALGELLIVPSVYAFCSEVAPADSKGLTMGLVGMAFAMANFLSGLLSQASQAGGESYIPMLFLAIAGVAAVIFAATSLYGLRFLFKYNN